jgi:hypothetical protein
MRTATKQQNIARRQRKRTDKRPAIVLPPRPVRTLRLAPGQGVPLRTLRAVFFLAR